MEAVTRPGRHGVPVVESPSPSSDTPVRAARGERVALSTILSWGAPVVAASGGLFFVQFFFLNFATDVLLMAPATVGVIFALGRLWDAVSDPIVGTWSDRTRTSLGRRRPWMLAGVPLLMVTLLMTWIPPESLVGGSQVAWVALSLFGFYTAFTCYIVPHQSLGAELSTDHHDRSRIFGIQSAFFTLGIMLAFPGMQYVTLAADPRAAAAGLILVWVVVMGAVLLVPPLLVRERTEYQGRGGQSSFRAMGDVLRSHHARRLLFAQFVQMLGTGVIGILSPYLVLYILRRPELIGPLPAAFVVFSVASIPVWIRLSRRFGKRDAWAASLAGAAVAFSGIFFVGEGDVALVFGLLVVAGMSLGAGGVIGPSILADVIDADELATGERKEGAYSAAWGFAIKSSNALVILITSVALQLSGFEPNVDQTDSTKLVLRVLYAGMPLVMFLAAARVLRGFGLDEVEHARIRAELDRRR
jgi:GPH family glycoside/pentoside/hexuronide:cation symporter